MKLFNIEKLDNDYTVEFIFNTDNTKYFNDYNSIIGRIRNATYDLKIDKWIIPKEALYLFEDLEEKAYPKPKEKLNKEIKPKKKIDIVNIQEEKNITNYENIGTYMKLKPYKYQQEIIKYILDNKEVLVVAPCGSGKDICRLNKIVSLDYLDYDSGIKLGWRKVK